MKMLVKFLLIGLITGLVSDVYGQQNKEKDQKNQIEKQSSKQEDAQKKQSTDPIVKKWNETYRGKYAYLKMTDKQNADPMMEEMASTFRLNINKKSISVSVTGQQRRFQWQSVEKSKDGYLVTLKPPRKTEKQKVQLKFEKQQITYIANGKPMMVFTKIEKGADKKKLEEAMKAGVIEITLERINQGKKRRGAGVGAPGSKVKLTKTDKWLKGKISVGKSNDFSVQLQLGSEIGKPITLGVDSNADGKISEDETSKISAKKTRGLHWFSKNFTLQLTQDGKKIPYATKLWLVQDPQEKAKPAVLRWTPSHWGEGLFKAGPVQGKFFVIEMDKDGMLTEKDLWCLTSKRASTVGMNAMSEGTEKPIWFQGVPFNLVSIDSKKMVAKLKAVDLGMSEEEYKKKTDPYAADKAHPRAEKRVAFVKDYEEAMKIAKKENKRVFIDVYTTWCGPCAKMDEFVFTSKPFADRAKKHVCLKLDAEKHKEVAKKLKVEGYPTVVLLEPNGKEIRRATGYQSVKEIKKFLKTEHKKADKKDKGSTQKTAPMVKKKAAVKK